MSKLGMHTLHSLLLARAQDTPSLEDARKDLLLLHAVLVARLAKQGITKPTEAQVYRELQRVMNEK